MFLYSTELYALSRYFDANIRMAQQLEESKLEESELRLAQLQHQLPSNEPGALMQLVKDATDGNEEDEDTKECKGLFKNMKFFLSREVRLVCWFKSYLLNAFYLHRLAF